MSSPKEFTLEDARKFQLMRMYQITIEKKVTALLASDEGGANYTKLVAALRELLAAIQVIEEDQRQLGPCTCYEGYECCSGICEPWCS